MKAEPKRDPADRFLEGERVVASLKSLHFSVDSKGRRWCRLEFSAALQDLENIALPAYLRQEAAGMRKSNVRRVDFLSEFPQRMVEIYSKDAIAVTIEGTIQRIFAEVDPDGPTLHFSIEDLAANCGHWAVDHYGDPLVMRVDRIQRDFSE